MAEEFSRLPRSLTFDPRFAKHEGMVAQHGRDWGRALRAYRRAFAYEPYNQGVVYRLRFVLGHAKETAEFDRINQYYIDFKVAFLQLRGRFFESADRKEDPKIEEKDFKQTRGAYLEAVAIKTLGATASPEIVPPACRPA